MTDELKPCPFCGQQPDVSMGGSFVAISCPRCRYEFDWARHGGFDWRGEWNARPTEDALQQRITELETQIAALQHEYEVVVSSRAHARAEWERLESENARLVDRVARLEEIIHAARTALDEVIIAPPRGTKADGRVVPKIDPDLGW